MSLRSFHVLFITLALLLAFGLAWFEYRVYSLSRCPADLALCIVLAAMGAGLLGYRVAFRRKMQKLGALAGIVAVLAHTPTARACALCMGAKDAPVAPAVNASIFLLLCVLAVVAGCFLFFAISIARREQGDAEQTSIGMHHVD